MWDMTGRIPDAGRAGIKQNPQITRNSTGPNASPAVAIFQYATFFQCSENLDNARPSDTSLTFLCLIWDHRRCPSASTLLAERREGRGVVGVDGGSTTSATGASLGGGTRSGVGASTGAATSTTTSTALATLSTSTATTTTAALGALGGGGALLPAAIVVDRQLLLLLTLTQLLATGGGDEVLSLVLLEGLGASPLVSILGLADLLCGLESKLLLGLLGEVSLKGNLLDLGLLVLSLGIFSLGVLLLGLSNGLSGLLVLELSLTLLGTP